MEEGESEARETARPKVGLVLGGGGARGLAHVGVIRWLEENRVPVDYISGTSIGGLIGSLYAMGYSADEIAREVETLDWNRLFNPVPPYRESNLRRKQDTEDFPTQIELGWKQGLAMPEGFNAGHYIGLLFDRMTLPYSGVQTFDEFPIPFRCVATDIETGQGVVFKDGSLSLALRSTMAIPGVFTPVQLDGRLLADGGILNNVPVDVAKEMGADIVIAVDVGASLQDRSKLHSVLAMIDQSINIMMLENVRRSMALADVVLVPTASEFGILDFNEYPAIEALGYEAAASKSRMLSTLSLGPQEWDEYLSAKRRLRRTDSPRVNFVEVEGTNPRTAEAIARSLSHHAHRQVDPDALEKDLTTIYGQGRYYGVGYQAPMEPDGQILAIRISEKTYGPPFIRFGLNIMGSELDHISFGAKGRVTLFDVWKPGAEFRLDADVGTPLGASAEYYRPLFGRWFLAPRAKYRRSVSSLFLNGVRSAEYRTNEGTVGIDLGWGVGLPFDELRIGYDLGRINSVIRIGDPLLPTIKGNIGRVHLGWLHDDRDAPVVPRQGTFFDGGVDHFLHTPGSPSDLTQASFFLSHFQRISNPGSIFLFASAGTTFGSDAPPALEFSLGGPLRLGALSPAELRGSRFVFSSLGYYHEVARTSLVLASRLFLAGWYELGSAYNRHDSVNYYQNASGGLILDSLLGPLFVGGSVGEGGKYRFYFSMGRLF